MQCVICFSKGIPLSLIFIGIRTRSGDSPQAENTKRLLQILKKTISCFMCEIRDSLDAFYLILLNILLIIFMLQANTFQSDADQREYMYRSKGYFYIYIYK